MGEAETPAATPAESSPAQPKVKIKKPRQRACDEKDPGASLPAKSQVCCGHLKRWYDYPKEIEALVGGRVELYRCENCKTLYLPDRSELARSYTHRF